MQLKMPVVYIIHLFYKQIIVLSGLLGRFNTMDSDHLQLVDRSECLPFSDSQQSVRLRVEGPFPGGLVKHSRYGEQVT